MKTALDKFKEKKIEKYWELCLTKPNLTYHKLLMFFLQSIQEAFILGADVYKIGQHGAVRIVTRNRDICGECGLPVEEIKPKKGKQLRKK